MQDNRNTHPNLFSRGTTPPSQREPAHEAPATSQILLASHPHSISVDSLFRNINTAPAPATTFYSPPPQSHSPQLPPHTSYTPPVVSDGGRSSPLSLHSHHSDSINNFGGMTSPGPSTSEYRQTALLSLLGPAGPLSSSAPAPTNQQRGPNEASGKMLLEQLMSGPSEQQQQQQAPPQSSSYYEDAPRKSAPQPAPPSPQSQQQSLQGSMTDRKTLFDFVSPFDALNSAGPPPPGPTATKKKPVPNFSSNSNPTSPRLADAYPQPLPQQQQPPPQQQQQTRQQPSPIPPPLHGVYHGYPENLAHIFHAPLDYPSIEQPSQYQSQQSQQQQQSQRPLPMPPQQRQNQNIPQNPSPPPHSHSPPHGMGMPAHMQPQNRPEPIESPIPVPANVGPPQLLNTRDESSPSPAAQVQQQQSLNKPIKKDDLSGSGSGSGSGAGKGKSASPQGPTTNVPTATKGHRVPVPSDRPIPSPTYVLDVLTPLQSTLASHGLINITPIALLKLDPLYLPGTTIGVSSFIAYAMTKGRVRLIARSNGARALLKLPNTFPLSTSVQDMAVSGNRLACVTNDGGCVVWEVPSSFDDDASSKTLLHILPTPGPAGFKSVKWHPKQPGTLAIASDRQIHLLNVQSAAEMFNGEAIDQDDLARTSKVFSIPSSLVSFTFDVPQIAVASISVDSTVTLWSMKDKLPFWSGRVAGDGPPSSIDFLEGGIIIGRKQGTVLQLLPVMSTTVCSTIKFVMGPAKKPSSQQQGQQQQEEEEPMFGHVSYDPKIRTLWVANSARASLFAIRVSFDSMPSAGANTGTNTGSSGDAPTIRPSFDQIVEFPTTMQCINMTLLNDTTPSSASDPNAVSPQDANLAVAVFAVHTGGVDQVNITRDAFEGALNGTAVKLPPPAAKSRDSVEKNEGGAGGGKDSSGGEGVANPARRSREVQQQQQQQERSYGGQQAQAQVGLSQGPSQPQSQQQQQQQQQQQPQKLPLSVGGGASAPPSDPEAAVATSSGATPKGLGGKNGRGGKKIVDAAQVGKTPLEGGVGGGAGGFDETALVGSFTKEFKKAEETLHNRLARLISKELDKQHQRLEDLRHEDQAADFNRQEMILKLISHELTKNTTRVVELAVKSEIQNSVLPALENVTRNEVKSALGSQIAKGLTDTMKQTLPIEIERLLLRPDVSNHVARTFSNAITPIVERQVKDSFTNTLVPAYTEVSNAMHQELSREIRSEILNLRKEVVTWQAEALKGQESLIRDMEHSLRSLTEQVKILSLQIPVQASSLPARISPGPPPMHQQQQQQPPQQMHMQHMPPHMRQQNLQSNQALPPQQMGPSSMSQMSYVPQTATQPTWLPGPPMQQQQQPQQQQQQQQQSQPPSMTSSTMSNNSQQQATPPITARANEDYDEIFLSTLAKQDPKQLRELLQRCNPAIIMPPNGQPSPLSQAVILTLVHRLSSSLAELSPVDESFKSGLWWLQRAAHTLSATDPVIAPYVTRVLNTAQSILGTTASRLSLLPGGPSLVETNSMISQIQQTLASKTN